MIRYTRLLSRIHKHVLMVYRRELSNVTLLCTTTGQRAEFRRSNWTRVNIEFITPSNGCYRRKDGNPCTRAVIVTNLYKDDLLSSAVCVFGYRNIITFSAKRMKKIEKNIKKTWSRLKENNEAYIVRVKRSPFPWRL